MAREKKEKPPKVKKEKPPKKEKLPRGKKGKEPKEPKEQKEETLLQKLMRQAKIKGAEEPPEEGAEPEAQEEKPGGGKRKLILLIAAAVLVLAAVAVVVIFVVLPRLSNREEPPPEESPEPVLYDLPESYEVGEETVKAVEPLLPDGVQAVKDPRVCYTYTDMTNAGAEASAYVSDLKTEGFSVVDAEFVRTDAPDFETAEGTVLLAKDMEKKAKADAAAAPSTDPDASIDPAGDAEPSPTPEEEPDMVLTVELTWAPETLLVVCDQAEGKVTNPPPPDRPPVTPGATMSMWEAEEFLRELEPSVLGLEGESMEDYHIYAIDGAVLVNGQPCMRLNIYSREENQSNEVAGIYLMSRDGQHLYLLDEEAKSVKEIQLPAN